MSSKASTVVSKIDPIVKPAALKIATSTGPRACSALSNRAAMAASSEASAPNALALLPVASISETNGARAPAFRRASATE